MVEEIEVVGSLENIDHVILEFTLLQAGRTEGS